MQTSSSVGLNLIPLHVLSFSSISYTSDALSFILYKIHLLITILNGK